MPGLNGKLTVHLHKAKGLKKPNGSPPGQVMVQVLVNGASVSGKAHEAAGADWQESVALDVADAPLGATARFIVVDVSGDSQDALGSVSMALPDNSSAAGVFDAAWHDVVAPDGKSLAGQLNFGMEWAPKRASSRGSSRKSRVRALASRAPLQGRKSR